MSVTATPEVPLEPAGRCRRQQGCGELVLVEVNPHAVIDDIDPPDTTLNLLTFGSVRELCPKCRRTHLKLILRQHSVRMAHLFCAACESCFDAHYANGTPALSL